MGVFDLAWSLYRRGFVFLLLAGLFASVVESAIVYAAIVVGLGGAMGVNQIVASPATSLYTGVSAATVGLLFSQLIVLVLRGGMMKMVIDSERSGERMDFTSVFAGFTRFPSYVGLWGITAVAVPFGVFVLLFAVLRIPGPLASILSLAMAIFAIWLMVSWAYGLPLIADGGLDPVAALARSRGMVRENGWWTTFLPLLLLAIASWLITAVVDVAAMGSGMTRYLNIGALEILWMPFMICFVAAMYMGGDRRTLAPSPLAPAPDTDAWTAAADPLAGLPPHDPA